MIARFLSAALFGAFALLSTGAEAQRAATGFSDPMPEPIRRGGHIRLIEQRIADEVAPGECLVGTYMSADLMALGVPGVRVSPYAVFWPHHAKKRHKGSPWRVSHADDAYILARLNRPKLAVDIYQQMARYPMNSEFHFYYTGADLIARFGYRPC